MKITQEDLREWWGKDLTVRYKSRLYRVGKMSYGDYFLEPRDYKGGERDPHSPHTRFFYLKEPKVYGIGDEIGV